jgi:hypothetical protein
VVWFSREGKQLGEAAPPGDVNSLALSPDARRLAVARADPESASRNVDLWLREFDRSVETRLTFDPGFEGGAPVWSPDGKWLAFASGRDGANAEQIYRVETSGGGQEERLTDGPNNKIPLGLEPGRKVPAVSGVQPGEWPGRDGDWPGRLQRYREMTRVCSREMDHRIPLRSMILECSRASRVPALCAAAAPPLTRTAPSKSLHLRGMGHAGTASTNTPERRVETGGRTGGNTVLARANAVVDVVHFS